MRTSPLLTGVAAAVVLSLVILVGSADSVRAEATFNPELAVELDTTDPLVPSGFVTDFNLPKGDVNFAGVVAFIPTEWGLVKGDAIPVGADVGTLTAAATLGLINSNCNSDVPVEFEMKNGSLDQSDTIQFTDSEDEGTTLDFADDDDGDEIANGIEMYPDWLLRLFPDAPPPIRRSAGVTLVAGTPVILQFLIFPPGTEINENIPSEAERGYPSVTVLQNAGDPDIEPQPGIIVDFCTPLTSHNVTLGETADGTQLTVNPSDGTYTFSVFAAGLRDADGDGYENSLDTCAYDANVGDPRTPNDGDADSDGIDTACDPNDDEINSDEDLDGYQNRQDNCPLVANGQAEADIEGVGNQTDGDLDQIGLACDMDDTTPDGDLSFAEPSVEVVIGSGNGGEVGAAPDATACPDCYVYEPGGANGGSSSSDDDDSSSSTLIIVVIAVIAGIVILGGGAALMMRRRGS